MFWKREDKKEQTPLGLIISIPPIPPKKEFTTMLELLRDAEKYDTSGEPEVSKKILSDLCDFILKYCAKNESHN